MKKAFPDRINENDFLSFLYKFLAFILIVFLLDLVVGSTLNYFYFKQSSGFQYRATYAIRETKADILIFGSSKATHQYEPGVFEKRLNLSYYNVGRDGSSILYQYAVLKAVLKRYSPKMIVLDVGREFENKSDSYDRLSMLLPYYQGNPEMRPLLDMKSPYEKYKLLSRIYPFNSLLFSIIAGNSEFNKGRFDDIKGYLPLTRKWEQKLETLSATASDYELDSTKITAYESFINDCVKSKIELYIVSSPHFYKYDFVEKSETIGKEIAQKYKINYFNYAEDSVFLQTPVYFADVGHLNNTGATVFSNLIVDQIVKSRLSEGQVSIDSH